MQIEQERNEDRLLLKITGSLNEMGAEALKKELDAIDPASVREVELDCRQVEHFGSSSIGKLLIFYKRMTSQGGKMSVTNLPSPIYEMFLELKLDTLFPVSQSQ